MSKNRKHRKPPVAASIPAPLAERILIPPPGNGGQTSGVVFSRGILLQLLAIVGLSCVLGFTFNSASPVGVRSEQPTAAPLATTANVTEATPPPPPPLKTNPIVTPPLPPVPVKVAATPPQPMLPAARPVASPRPWSVSASPPPTNPVVVATPPPPAQSYPTPIHWPEAKAMAAEGRGVLIDVRHKAMYDAGHIPDAVSLPETSPPEEFRTFLSQQPTNMALIVYCSSTSCSQSARVANRLVHEFQWPAVRFMTGGYAEYVQAELAKPAPQPAP